MTMQHIKRHTIQTAETMLVLSAYGTGTLHKQPHNEQQAVLAPHLAEILDRSACSGSRSDRRTKVDDRSVRWYFQLASSFLSCA